jgi:hypothetical protein
MMQLKAAREQAEEQEKELLANAVDELNGEVAAQL